MTRFAAALVLLLPAVAVRAQEELHPRSSYVGLYAVLGGLAGGVLGASLGGLERYGTDDSTGPLVRWGLAGGAMGMILGRQVGKEALVTADRPTGTPPPGVRGSSACLGAILGQVAGLGFTLARQDEINWSGRAVWGNIALGSVLGAGLGSMISPLSFLPAPAPRSARESSLESEQTDIQPLLPDDREPDTLGPQQARGERIPESNLGSPRTLHEIRELDSGLLASRSGGLLDPSSATVPPTPRAHDLILPATAAAVPPVVNSVAYLGLIEGALLGAAAVGSLASDSADLGTSITAGGIAGALAGYSAASSLSRPWRERSFTDRSDVINVGKRTSGVLTGGIVGSLAGAALGAAMRNTIGDFSEAQAVRTMLAGNIAGLIIGSILSAPGR